MSILELGVPINIPGMNAKRDSTVRSFHNFLETAFELLSTSSGVPPANHANNSTSTTTANTPPTSESSSSTPTTAPRITSTESTTATNTTTTTPDIASTTNTSASPSSNAGVAHNPFGASDAVAASSLFDRYTTMRPKHIRVAGHTHYTAPTRILIAQVDTTS